MTFVMAIVSIGPSTPRITTKINTNHNLSREVWINEPMNEYSTDSIIVPSAVARAKLQNGIFERPARMSTIENGDDKVDLAIKTAVEPCFFMYDW